MNYILCEFVDKGVFDAGNKARTDAINIALKKGYKHIPLFRSGSNRITIFFQLIKGCLKVLFLADKNSSVLLQYPYYPRFVDDVIFKVLALGKKIKKYKMVLLIHDVIALREESSRERVDTPSLKKELEMLKPFDRIICHNPSMIKLFNSAFPNKNYWNLAIFDYLYEGKTADVKYSNNPEVIVAGNLMRSKCGYLYTLPSYNKVKFNLYGINYEENDNDSLIYKGKFDPNELISHLEGMYGLVWDGDSYKSCVGICGTYLRYNNPHKASLYIAAGIPLIVWSKSALAELINKTGIGICVDSLEYLDEFLSNITREDYQHMRDNLMRIRSSVIEGSHLANAIS